MKISKHAYLIMAHDNWTILSKLLQLIDDPRHDIFLHIDAKSDTANLDIPILQYSVLTKIESKPVYWADFSQVETEMRLLKAASDGGYSYYHLLSGVDMPLKTNNERYHFFENSGKNFVAIVPCESFYSVRRVKYFHPLLHNPFYRTCMFLKALDRIFEYTQRVSGVNRLRRSSWKIIDGWQWFSIRHDLALAVIQQENSIKEMFHSSIASDELFLQTLIYNTPGFRETLYDEKNLKKGPMRYIDWQRGRPYTFGGSETKSDYELLMNSPYMFARKFSEEKSALLVDRIYHDLMKKQKR